MANVKKGKGPTTPLSVVLYSAEVEALERIRHTMGSHASRGDVIRLCIKLIDDQVQTAKRPKKEARGE
jgi:hypothetical protein